MDKGKINSLFAKLPFKALAERIPAGARSKIPLLDKVIIPYANQIACALGAVVLATVIGSASGGGGGGSVNALIKEKKEISQMWSETFKDAMTYGTTGGTQRELLDYFERDEEHNNKVAKLSDSQYEKYLKGIGQYPTGPEFEFDLVKDENGIALKKYNGLKRTVTIPTESEGMPVISVRNDAFKDNKRIVSVAIPDSVYMYGTDGVFFGCSALTSVKLPKGTVWIPRLMFAECESLSDFTIPDTVYDIQTAAFRNTGLKSVVIPEGVTVIEGYTFANCKKLTSVTLPESLQEIKNGAFAECENLETIKLPSHEIEFERVSSEDVLSHIFHGCSKLSLAMKKSIQDAGYTYSF
jgi:hypothetical protein